MRKPKKLKDIAGQRIGNMVAESATLQKSPSQAALWVFRCDCGGTAVMVPAQLRSLKNQNCGCSKPWLAQTGKHMDITGNRYGKLVAVERSPNSPGGRVKWLFKCDCGGTISRRPDGLKPIGPFNCGCSKSTPRPWAISDISGQRFGMLVAISQDGFSTCRDAKWLCMCDCGREKVTVGSYLKAGKVKSCGCFKSEFMKEAMETHGMSNTRIYHVWSNMIARCNNPNIKNYHRYGGRGIRVDPRWIESFEDFYQDVADIYDESKTMDRIDNDLGYFLGNVRWSTQKEQCRNQSRTIRLNGVSLGDIYDSLDSVVSYNIFSYRVMKRGMNPLDAARELKVPRKSPVKK